MLRLFKRLTLIISVIILTGCSAEYGLTINNTKDINEYLRVVESDKSKFDIKQEELLNTTPKEYLETNIKWPLAVYTDETNPIEPKKVNGVDYYSQDKISYDSLIGIKYSFKHDFDMFKESKMLNKCYSYDLTSDNNIISFKTTSSFKCYEEYPILDDITFKLHTTCRIKDNNADEKKNNTLIYNIKKDNIDKNISFTIDCNEVKEQHISLTTLELVSIYFIVIGLIILIGRRIFINRNKI